MDERLRICLWMVSGGCLGLGLGSAFGALSGAMFARDGRVAGTRLARRMAEIFLETAEYESPSLARAALIGAADGVLFLGSLGLVAGLLLGASGRAADELLPPLLAASVLLFGGATFFGLLAYAMSRSVWTVCNVIAGGLLGSFVAALTAGADHLLLGTVPGLILGLLVSIAARRYTPAFRPPRVAKPLPRPRSVADITGSPPSRRDVDFFPKRDDI